MLPKEDLSCVFAQTDWTRFRGARIFVTGGTGFFGQWLLESIAWANARAELGLQVTVLTRNAAAFLAKTPDLAGDPAFEFVPGDVVDFAFPKGEFTHVIHAASETTPRAPCGDPRAMIHAIIHGSARSLEFAVQAKVRRFLMVSSGAVYGRQPAELERVPETYMGAPDPALPGSAYGEAKRLAELFCACAHRSDGVETIIARCFAFLGPGLPLERHYAAGNFIRDALRGGPIQVKGDGSAVRSYLYPADLAIWLWTLLSKGTPGRAYNVGSVEPISIAGLAHRIAALAGPNLEVCIGERNIAQASPEVYVPATDLVRAEFGLTSRTDLDSAIQKTLEWHRRLAR